MSVIAVFIFGLVTGSFLNVCIYRIPRRESVLFPRSACPACGARLRWHELVPLASYLVQGGRCRTCHSRISPRYPLVELLTGALFALAYLRYGFTAGFAALVTMGSLLTVTSFIDAEHRIIPNGLVLAGMIAGVAAGLARGAGVPFMSGGLAAGFGLMLAVAVISRGRMGMGDVKLSGVLGIFLGWQAVLVALFVAFICGACYGLLLMVLAGRSGKTAVPFGPFLAVGAIVAYIWASDMIRWYLSLVLQS